MRLRRYGLGILVLGYAIWMTAGSQYVYIVPAPSKSASSRSLSPDIAFRTEPQRNVALLLSGGGYRAMLFHMGALLRLNEAGLLPDVKVVSSVSGGSIAAAILGLKWKALQFDREGVAQNFEREVIVPARGLASRTIDVGAVGWSLLPWRSAAQGVIGAYRAELFGNATLQDLPDRPFMIIHATNMQSGFDWTFSKRDMGDGRVGLVSYPNVELAAAVAASSAFPPFLSPVILKINPAYYDPPQLPFMDLHQLPYMSRVFLTDAGVHDNLGFFTGEQFDAIMVSDASSRPVPDASPRRDWLSQALRAFDLVYAQPALLRIDAFIAKRRAEGQAAYVWSIRDALEPLPVPGFLSAPSNMTKPLSAVPTRLASMSGSLQKQLINFGYAVADTKLRMWTIYPERSSPEAAQRVSPYADIRPPKSWPFPECDFTAPLC
jgi:NTE family protein